MLVRFPLILTLHSCYLVDRYEMLKKTNRQNT